jgi:hypothetical protein
MRDMRLRHPERILAAVVAGYLALSFLFFAIGLKTIAYWMYGIGVAIACVPLVGGFVYLTYEKFRRRIK